MVDLLPGKVTWLTACKVFKVFKVLPKLAPFLVKFLAKSLRDLGEILFLEISFQQLGK